ncbi:hypothetical protein NQZ68_028739 [Dissostichus eleginoides]|nr:hypothetical protein NQZ68_028739 [Dissostichus eleginoides]
MNVCKHEKVERKAKDFFFRRSVETFWEGGGFEGLCSNPQKIQSEKVEGVDLPEEEEEKAGGAHGLGAGVRGGNRAGGHWGEVGGYEGTKRA